MSHVRLTIRILFHIFLLILFTNASDSRAQIADPTNLAEQATEETSYTAHFLLSIKKLTGIHLVRLELAARKTFLAHPPLLQKWGLINQNAGATYNWLTRTLIVEPDLTIKDGNQRRIRTIFEMAKEAKNHPESSPFHPTISAGIVLHELSHAEWSLIINKKKTGADVQLLDDINKYVNPMKAGFFTKMLLPSEIYAYYRESLFYQILSDVSDILLSSGIEPLTGECSKGVRSKGELRDISPNRISYSERARIQTVWVLGKDVSLQTSLDPEAVNLNNALYKHTETLEQIPKDRSELFNYLNTKIGLRQKISACAR